MSYTCGYCHYVKKVVLHWEELTLADVNEDGDLNQKDAEDILKYITDNEVQINEEAGDIDGDGNINLRDIAVLLLYLKDPSD